MTEDTQSHPTNLRIYLYARFPISTPTYFFGFRCRDRYKIKKGEPVIVLSNHQTDADPLCILSTFSIPLYPVATDNIFSSRLATRFFNYISVIPKKKGASDVRSVLKMYEYLKRGSSVILFPEGNRYYAEFQYYIPEGIAAMLKRFHATLIIFNLHGGSGVSPRFKNRSRRGPFYGEINASYRMKNTARWTTASCTNS